MDGETDRVGYVDSAVAANSVYIVGLATPPSTSKIKFLLATL